MLIDVAELLKLLESEPQAKGSVSVILALKEVGEKLEYPVNSYHDLMKQLGNKPVVINDLIIDTNRLKDVIPKYYFPIASKEDLIDKGQEIYKLSNIGISRMGPTLPIPPPGVAARVMRSVPPFLKFTHSQSSKVSKERDGDAIKSARE